MLFRSAPPLHTIMIRLFLNICNLFPKIKHLDDLALFSLFEKRLPTSLRPCPSCGSPSSSFSFNGSYYRYLISYYKGTVLCRRISVRSLLCASCHKSHALLLSILIPHSSFSLSFLISLLYARLTRQFPSILSLCEHFGISESSFYRLRKRFTLDSKELIRILKSFSDNLDLLEFLRSSTPFILHSALELFFRSAGYSFLQPCVNLRPRINLRSIPPGFYQIP